MRLRSFHLPWVSLMIMLLLAAGCAGQQQADIPLAAATYTPNIPASGNNAVSTAEATATQSAVQPEMTTTAQAAPGNGLRFDLVTGESKARYRVREQLANVTLPVEAIGETDQVSGSVVLLPDGTVDPATSRFEVNLSTLKSDRSNRDNYLRRNTLQTDQYPTAVFVPRQVNSLTLPLPNSGEVNFQLIGDLTIREVTKEVTWEVSGTLQDGRANGLAVTRFTFADFDLIQPSVPIVLSIEDEIILEVDVVLQSTGAPVPQTGASGASQPVALSIDCTPPASLTPPMTEGPYYKPNAPERTSLLEPGIPGTRLQLTGYVLNSDCQPIPNAMVDFWQTDGNGVYDNEGFKLRGRQYTGADGHYKLETVLPGEYPGRTPHIHVKVQSPGGPVLTSQVFFPGAQQNQTDRIFDPALLVTVLESSNDMEAVFHFVVQEQ